MKLLIANFKMNKTVSETKEYLDVLIHKYKREEDKKIVVCLPFTSLHLAEKYPMDNVFFGAQNMHEETSGAYTGEISGQMLKEVGVKFVLLGHSERRKYFNETNDRINKKIKSALRNGLEIILCVGETRSQRNTNKTIVALQKQITEALSGIYENELKSITIAYEPVWAIGTGKVAESKDISNAAQSIKDIVKKLYTNNTDIKVVYGGSLTNQNLSKLIKNKHICGFLSGGASLDVEEFLRMINKI